MKHYEFEISQFVDGELNGGEKNELFRHLSECSECQKIFSEYLTLNEKSKDFCAGKISDYIQENLPITLNSAYAKINTGRKWNRFYKSAFYISSAAAVILLFLTVTRKPDTEVITKTVSRVDTLFVPKERVVYKTVQVNSVKQLKNTESNEREYIKYVLNMRSEKWDPRI